MEAGTGTPIRAATAATGAARGDALGVALEATRLLGRWSMVAQRHGSGCSCCPGLGEVGMDQVERQVLGGLRMRHPVLADRESLVQFLKDCVRHPPADGPDAAARLRALFTDVGAVIDQLERIQAGGW